MIRLIILFTSIVLATVACRYMDFSLLSQECSEIVTFLGILSAAIIPAMIFTAEMKPGEKTCFEDAQKLNTALQEQMMFWIVFFYSDIIACILVLVGKAISWKLSFGAYDVSFLIKFFAMFFVIFTILEIVELLRGVKSLQKINGKIFIADIQKRNNAIADDIIKKGSEQISLPENYGKQSENI